MKVIWRKSRVTFFVAFSENNYKISKVNGGEKWE